MTELCRVPAGLDQNVALDLEADGAPDLRSLQMSKVPDIDDKVASALRAELGKDVSFWAGWRTRGKGEFAKGRPVGLLLHHTGGAATSSTNPKAPGNQPGANNGVVRFVSNHPDFGVPCSQVCLDRDGHAYVMCTEWTYHAGLGNFPGSKTWDPLKIPANMGNSYLLGVEMVSKGQIDDITGAQWHTLGGLLRGYGNVYRWPDPLAVIRRPRHRDYAGPRKVDLKASNAEVTRMLKQYA